MAHVTNDDIHRLFDAVDMEVSLPQTPSDIDQPKRKCALMSCASPVHEIVEHPQRGPIAVCRNHYETIQNISEGSE